MKKILVVLNCCFLFSCAKSEKVYPIEKYQGQGIILLENPNSADIAEYLYVKNKDSVFTILIPSFDAKNLKQGDTIK